MMNFSIDRLEAILARHALLQASLNAALDGESFVAASKELADINPVVDGIRAWQEAQRNLTNLEEMAGDPALEPEMRALVREERVEAQSALDDAAKALQLCLLPKDKDDEKSAILEIRAGTGGDEASLFAGDLLDMYRRYSALKGWSFDVISASEGTMGGFKEVVAEVKGKDVFAKLKFESGVHRVQRVPDTETQGRIHTSAATVAVLPEAEEVDVSINDADLKIDTMRSGGAGGQHVNKTESAVRITHLPSGIVVLVQDERSQHKNRARAMVMLRAKLYEKEREALALERAENRKSQVGSGDRSERIRTYNFPQGRVSDHRINLTLYKIEEIMQGALDEVVDALIADHQATLIAENEA